ncbi:MAG: OmpA family protein [Polyangiaceae bacterium]
MRRVVAAGVALTCLLTCVLTPAALHAEPLRWHGNAGIAKAITGHQKDEFSLGVSGTAAMELPLTPSLGLALQVGGLWFDKSADPADPNIKPESSFTSGQVGLGARLRPFYASWDYESGWSAAGLWLSAAGGPALTAQTVRPSFDAYAGWDYLFGRGAYGVGPTVGFVHVFQPDDELRPADANILVFGVHGFVGKGKPAVDGDRDGDGIKDSIDRCPDDREDPDGWQDDDGCPELDNDLDGIEDIVDQCANDPEDKDGFEDQDGCPDRDNDQDAILDGDDKCPNDPEDRDGFEDQDGCPDDDNDKDGIPDKDDKCPDEPEVKNGYADDDGCPDAEQVRVVGDKIYLDDRVHFWVNSAKIRPVSYPLLERVAQLIADNPSWVHVEVQGHTDERGPEWFNEKLSQDRAASVAEFLASKGLVKERLSAKGFGSSQPMVDKKSERAWFMNRRVEFQITRQIKVKPTTGRGAAAGGER